MSENFKIFENNLNAYLHDFTQNSFPLTHKENLLTLSKELNNRKEELTKVNAALVKFSKKQISEEHIKKIYMTALKKSNKFSVPSTVKNKNIYADVLIYYLYPRLYDEERAKVVEHLDPEENELKDFYAMCASLYKEYETCYSN